jgi:hypothetical protein
MLEEEEKREEVIDLDMTNRAERKLTGRVWRISLKGLTTARMRS